MFICNKFFQISDLEIFCHISVDDKVNLALNAIFSKSRGSNNKITFFIFLPCEKHKNHPSVNKTSQTFISNETFSFQFVTKDQEDIMNLNVSKATLIGDISVDILKSTVDIHLPFTTNSMNLSIEKSCFPEELKLVDVNPIFKKKDDLDKENYRPVSALQHVSKVFERIIYHQIRDYMRDKLSKQLTGFRKSYIKQHCLNCILEIWKKVLDKGGYVCAIFMDL